MNDYTVRHVVTAGMHAGGHAAPALLHYGGPAVIIALILFALHGLVPERKDKGAGGG